MKISTKGRYALRVLIDLAEHEPDVYVPLQEIADNQQISEKYLEKVINQLSKSGFVKGIRGKGGGYRLTKKPEEYTVRSVLEVMEKDLAPVACLECEENECERASICKTLPLWEQLQSVIYNFFDSYTLQDLMNGDFKELNLYEKNETIHEN